MEAFEPGGEWNSCRGEGRSGPVCGCGVDGREVQGQGGAWRSLPLYRSSSYFQSCHHLGLPVLGKGPTHPGPLPGLQARRVPLGCVTLGRGLSSSLRGFLS